MDGSPDARDHEATDHEASQTIDPAADAMTDVMSSSWLMHRAARAREAGRRLPLPLVAALVWVTWWLVLYLTGQGIELRTVYAGWQTLPVEALRDGVLESLVDLHIQPPLWNLLIGAVVSWSPLSVEASIAIILVASGALLSAAISGSLQHLGVSRGRALLITVVATMSTQVMVFAFRSIYELPTSALLACLVWAVVAARRPNAVWVAAASLATATAMLRSLYHPVWVIATLLWVGWVLRPLLSRRQVVLGAMIPLMFIGGWTTLNGVRHHTYTLSSWSGMNLLRSVQPAVPQDVLDQMYRDELISGVGVVGPFRAYERYTPFVEPCGTPTGHPALDIELRPTPPEWQNTGVFTSNEAPNFNYRCYLQPYRLAGSDARAIIQHRPGDWFTARTWAADNWFEAPPVGAYQPSPLWAPADTVTGIAYLRVPHPPVPPSWEENGLWVHANTQTATGIIVWFASLLAAVASMITRWRRRNTTIDDSEQDADGHHIDGHESRRETTGGEIDRSRRHHLLVGVVGLTLGWTAVAGVMFELGEQGRFRTVTDPIALSVLLVLNWRWYRGWWRRLRTRPA